MFANNEMKKAEIVTAEGGGALTSIDENAILSIDEIKKRFNRVKGAREYITFKEWEGVLNETGYEIRRVGCVLDSSS